jgi:hypothetical protein
MNSWPTPYLPGSGRSKPSFAHSSTKKSVRNLYDDAGAVAGDRVGAHRAAMGEVDEHLQPVGNDVVRRATLHVGDETDAAGVSFVCRIEKSGRDRTAGACRVVCASRNSVMRVHRTFAPSSSCREALRPLRRLPGPCRRGHARGG